MATGIVKDNTLIGVKAEVTEGIFIEPAAATEFVQPLSDGFDLTPAKELIERDVLNNSIGKITPRVGQKSVTATLPIELKAEGTEGGTPQYSPLLLAGMGASRTISTQTTTKASNADDQLEIEDADIGKFTVGDIIVVLESGAHEVVAVKSVDSGAGVANIGIRPALTAGAPADNVVISKSSTFFTANTGHQSLSLSYYWANEIRESGSGTRVTSMAVENFTTGQIPNLNFSLEGLSFNEVDAAAPFTPVFDTALPPLALQACLFQDDTQLDINEFALTMENTLGFLTSTCSVNGRDSSRVTSRTISGTFNPYKDDTDVSQFTKFDANTGYSIFISAFNPSVVSGEIELGSAIGLFLPNCISTEKVVADQDGVLIENISFRATRGDAGSDEEMFLGFV